MLMLFLRNYYYSTQNTSLLIIKSCFVITQKNSCSAPTGLLHGYPSILQCPISTVQKHLVLWIHLLHLSIGDAKESLIKLIESVSQM